MSEEGAPDHHRALVSQGPKRPRVTKLARFFLILVFGVWAALTGVIMLVWLAELARIAIRWVGAAV